MVWEDRFKTARSSVILRGCSSAGVIRGLRVAVLLAVIWESLELGGCCW